MIKTYCRKTPSIRTGQWRRVGRTAQAEGDVWRSNEGRDRDDLAAIALPDDCDRWPKSRYPDAPGWSTSRPRGGDGPRIPWRSPWWAAPWPTSARRGSQGVQHIREALIAKPASPKPASVLRETTVEPQSTKSNTISPMRMTSPSFAPWARRASSTPRICMMRWNRFTASY